VVVALSALAVGVRLFVLPPSDAVVVADAVVILPDSGQAGLQEGLALANRSVAPVLVVLGGPARNGGAARLCAERGPIEVLCPEVPGDGRDRARALGELVAARGWSAVVLVDDRSTSARDALQIGRCTEAAVIRRAVGTRDPVGSVLAAVAEAPRYLRSLFLQQAC